MRAAIANTPIIFLTAYYSEADVIGFGGAAGGGDATSLYNRGIINWNAGHYEDAKNDFGKAAQAGKGEG